MTQVTVNIDENTIRDNEARVNITWAGQNGNLPDPVDYGASNHDIISWVQEAVRSGDVPGIRQDRYASFTDFVVDRFPAKDGLPHRITVRPKTPFGNA